MKRKIILFAILCCICCLNSIAQQSSVAYRDNQVRFSVISDGTIRMEWNAEGKFTDAPSFVAVCREYPSTEYQVKESRNTVEINTRKLTLKYRKGTGQFNADNLSITSRKGLQPAFCWKPGMKQKVNLGGTFRTLDGMDGDMRDGQKVEMPDGLLAKDGWTLIDDSRNFLFDNSDWAWVQPRNGKECQDWYFMGYGHDYKAALKDFTLFAGKMPLPPRYAFGYWWSRYWAYSDNDLRELVDDFQRYDIPLDVLVIDMDWHHTAPGKGGWTGWTWNERLFPDYRRLLAHLKERNLQVTLNLHPADGVAAYEERYAEVAQDMGMNPEKAETIPWVSSDKRFMQSVFDRILRPMEQAGVDFWWLDWQQFPYDLRVDSLSNTWWLNYCFFSDMERHRQTRPMLYHRWGGLGNHRYQIGFSGDSYISWKSLEFQPYFNSTASNVLYGYWSHDIGGHYHGTIEPEMYTRWLQFGCVAPIMRTHTSKGLGMHKEPWIFPRTYTDIISQTVRQRYRLVPYIYTMARQAYDEGVSLCRPLYYDYPESPEAYDFRNQYMFGDRMLVAPVTSPADSTGYARLKVWLPQGCDWYEWHTGTLLKGGQVVERAFAIDEYPLYLKAGSLLPLYNDRVNHLQGNDEEIILTLFPGGEGTFTLYEDNGNDRDYAEQYATTLLNSERRGNLLHVSIGARKGNYPGMPAEREFKIKVEASFLPESVTLDGKPVSYHYDGNEQALVIDLGTLSCETAKSVDIVYPEGAGNSLADGMKGKMRRIRRAVNNLKERMPGLVISEELGFMEEAGRNISYHPELLPEVARKFNDCYNRLPQLLEAQQVEAGHARSFLQEAGWQQP